MKEVESRIKQLQTISKKADLLESLNRQIARANAVDKQGKPIRNIDDHIRILNNELSELKSTKTTVEIRFLIFDFLIF